jgi:malonate decarboxylase epsilon subunit
VSVAFLCPGQGSQQPGMLHDLPDNQAVKETFEEASDTLNESVILLDSEEKLKSTRAVQLSLLIGGVASGRNFETEEALPDMVAGHSVGAFTAAVLAGVMSFRDAISVVEERGELMEKAYPHDYGMGVVVGLPKTKLEEILLRVSDHPVYLANLNSPDQITISGSRAGIQLVLEMAAADGARKAEFLNVSVPSHCPLLDPVADRLYERMDELAFSSPTIPYAGIRNARALRDPESIKKDLAFSVSNPVHWHEVTTLYYELGVRLFIELPPGRVLSDFANKAFPDARSIAVSESGMQTARILMERYRK